MGKIGNKKIIRYKIEKNEWEGVIIIKLRHNVFENNE